MPLEIDLERACRTCLAEKEEMIEIQNCNFFEIDESKSKFSLADILEDCISLNITPNDELPQSMCNECVNDAKQFFIYKKMCLSSDEKLRKYLDIKTEKIEIDEYSEISPEILVDYYTRDDLFDENVDTDVHESVQSNQNNSYLTEKVSTNSVESDEMTIVNRANQVSGRFQCEICPKTLADRKTLLLHIRLHLGSSKLKFCDVCGRGFAKQNHLNRHKITHDKSKKKERIKSIKRKTICTMKEEKTADVETYKTTTEKNETESIGLKVQSIDSKYRHKEILNATHTQGIALDEEELELMRAAKEVDGPSGTRLQCPICPRTLSQRKVLRLHIRAHVGKNLLHCKICNRGFAKGSNLNRHMLLHRNVDNEEETRILANAMQTNGSLTSYICPYCSKILIDRQSFRLHIRLHITKADELDGTFPCSKCDSTFDTYFGRKEHLKVEHNVNFKDSADDTYHVLNKNITRKNEGDKNDDDGDDDDNDEVKQLLNKSNCVDGRFKCTLCPKTLATRTTLKYHIRLHLGNKFLLICDICNQGFSKKSHLKRHMETHTRTNFPCRYCGATFDTSQKRKVHISSMHKDAHHKQINMNISNAWTQPNGRKNCICRLCNVLFERISELRTHLNIHLTETTSIEGLDFAAKHEGFPNIEITPENLQVINELNNPDPGNISKIYSITNQNGWEMSLSDSETDCDEKSPQHTCGRCEKQFERLHKLMCHMQSDHANIEEFQEFKCSTCNQYFPNTNILSKHVKQECGNKHKIHECTKCNNRFIWKSNLDQHEIVCHQKQNLFACEKCSKSFQSLDHLRAHLVNHQPREKKRFSCDICKKTFSRTDNLRSHMRVHIPVEEREEVKKTHLCSFCGRSFSNSSNLTVHLRRHTGERPFGCEFCSARFPRSSDLNCHRRSHTGEKTCCCTVCGKGFTRSNKLVRHMRIHTGEKPYKCEYCDRAFTQSNDLTLHRRRIHTGDKPFSCFCGERFITNSLLQHHKRSVGHMLELTTSDALPINSVNNPHRMFNSNDGKKTGITGIISNSLTTLNTKN